jgi:hypothetical protein
LTGQLREEYKNTSTSNINYLPKLFMPEIINPILTEAASCFKGARKNLMEGVSLLYQIRSESLYEPLHDSFSDYLESECHVSDSWASKALTAFQYYVVESGVSHAKLEGTDLEKLYLSVKAGGSPEEKLAKAQTLTRQELKLEIREEVAPHEHNWIQFCSICHKRHD